LLGQSRAWEPAVVSDAHFALNRATRRPTQAETTPAAMSAPPQRIQVGSGTVTAVASARVTGAVFVGFENGEIYCFRPQTSEVVRVSFTEEPLPVSSLAVAPRGEAVLAVWNGKERDLVGGWSHAPNGSFQPMEHHFLDHSGPHWLCPITYDFPALGAPNPCVFALLGNEHSVTMLSVPSLTLGPELWPVSHECHLSGGLAFSKGRGELTLAIDVFLFDGTMLLYGRSGNEWLECSLGWRPSIPEESSLLCPRIDWIRDGAEHLELVSVDEEGSLRWALLRLSDAEIVCEARNSASPAGGYLAATLIRPLFVAAVRSTSIHWLRARKAKGFRPWSITRVAIPTAVACFVSHGTHELIVVCRDGSLVRVAVPA
jgi:hypothetical protein